MRRGSVILPLVLLLAAAAGALAGYWFIARVRHETPGVSGTIEVDEVHVASRYGGRVEKIYAREGDALSTGDPIVDLEASELRARRDYAAALLAELEKGPRSEEIEAARQEWESLRAQLEFARTDAKRAQELLKERALSASEAERTASVASALHKSAEAARQRYQQLHQGTRPERIAQARAQLAEIEAQLREMRILAPSECVLEVLGVKVGDVLPPNREVATLIMPQHMWVRVYVPQPWLGHLRHDETVRVRVDAWPGEEFRGVVEQINRHAEFTPRNVQTVEERVKQVLGVKVRLDNRGEKLRAGMSADVFFSNVPRLP